MTWEIILIFVLLAATFAAFVWEKFSPDLIALSLLVILVATGLLPQKDALGVFSHPAPFTVAAMFVLSAALVKCGAVDRLSSIIERAGSLPYAVVIFLLVISVATISAFINNTPVVVVFLPVVLNLARRMKIAPSKLLIPLSYASVLGGVCTLIGTSTNLVVSGMIETKGLPPLHLFELAWLGVPMVLVGAIYMALLGNRLLPSREMLTSILSDEERREYITEAFVQPDSPAIGKTLGQAGLTPGRGVRVLEVVRDGIAFHLDAEKTQLRAGDRLILSCRPKGIAATRAAAGIDLVTELNLGLEQIAAHEGSLVEAVVNPNSELVGRTVREVNFRQRYRLVVLALHREGKNVREQVDSLPLVPGDVLLLMGTDQAINALPPGGDLTLFDHADRTPAKPKTGHIPLVLGVIATVILGECFHLVSIEIGALAGCVFLCLAGVLKPKEAYDSIEWPVIFIIFGMLAMGLALDRTGAAAWIAGNIVGFAEHAVPPEHKAFFVLAAIYFVTMVLTELLSNNAVAALMVP
ncbi:MAG: SLC13 family permease, partial [Burkholderiales bacterium]|nr:SLC13 family permease [Opitutaceae bacterium]